MKSLTSVLATWIVLSLVAGCGGDSGDSHPDANTPVAIAATLTTVFTQSPIATSALTVTETPAPTDTGAPAALLKPTNTAPSVATLKPTDTVAPEPTYTHHPSPPPTQTPMPTDTSRPSPKPATLTPTLTDAAMPSPVSATQTPEARTGVVYSRSLDPDDLSIAGHGDTIPVTVAITNHDDAALRGFFYSDQIPNGWAVRTVDVSLNGSEIADDTHKMGPVDEIYAGFTPYRWALEMPVGGSVFSPTHAISASGSTARITYVMLVSGGTGSDYSVCHDAWAGWLATVPTGVAVFGYEAGCVTDR